MPWSKEHLRTEIPQYTKEVKETSFGEAFTFVSHPFAHGINNEELLQLAIQLGLPSDQIEQAKQTIEATGFTTRYLSSNPESIPDLGKTMERTAEIGAILLKRALTAQGWDDLDLFIDTSAFLPLSINHLVLEKAGLDADRIITRSYRYACAGATGALVDVLADDNLKDARVAIAALEPLSFLIDRRQFTSLESLTIPAIFGDDHIVMAVNPARFQLHHKRILIQPDGGVLKLRTFYDFDQLPNQPSTIPDHYRFKKNGQNIFKYSQFGAHLGIETPENDLNAYMDGIQTGLFFGDETANLVIELLSELGEPDLLKKLDNQNIVMHPASQPVVNRIAKKLNRQGFLDQKTLSFIMGEIGRSNSSSATTLINWQHLTEQGKITDKKPFVLVAPGIGSAIAAAVGEFV